MLIIMKWWSIEMITARPYSSRKYHKWMKYLNTFNINSMRGTKLFDLNYQTGHRTNFLDDTVSPKKSMIPLFNEKHSVKFNFGPVCFCFIITFIREFLTQFCKYIHKGNKLFQNELDYRDKHYSVMYYLLLKPNVNLY